jgi:putative transposase
MRYRRDYRHGACYFFTVVTARRRPIFARPESVDLLRDAFRHVRQRHPFQVDAMVVLPDHVHCVWTLPANTADFSLRWQQIKRYFSSQTSWSAPCWQKRFWEHRIRDDRDYANHLDYIHYNPVKHGHVACARQWPYSSFGKWVARGAYAPDWGGVAPELPERVGHE